MVRERKKNKQHMNSSMDGVGALVFQKGYPYLIRFSLLWGTKRAKKRAVIMNPLKGFFHSFKKIIEKLLLD